MGSVFINFEEGFEVYEGFALNQKKACEIAVAESGKLAALSNIIDPTYGLPCFLIKPIQRICKYPLLLKEIVKFTPKDWPNYQNQVEALSSIKRVTTNVNETQRRVENLGVVKQLSERLIDWKGHNLDDFGALLHDGVFPVIKGDAEREYHLYLFENIILCCKESIPMKKSMSLSSKKQKTKRASLMLKGRIYIAFITDISSNRSNGYLLHLAWGSDANDSGFFDVRFRNDELLDQWESTIKNMVDRYNDPVAAAAVGLRTLPYVSGSSTLVSKASYNDQSDDEANDIPQQPSSSASDNSLDVLHDDDSTSTSLSHDLPNNISYPGDKTYPFAYQQQLSNLSGDLNNTSLTAPSGIPYHLNASHSGNSSSTSINNTLTHLSNPAGSTRQEQSKSVSSFSVADTAANHNLRTRSASVPTPLISESAQQQKSAHPIPQMPTGVDSTSFNTTSTFSTDHSSEPPIRNSNLIQIPPPFLGARSEEPPTSAAVSQASSSQTSSQTTPTPAVEAAAAAAAAQPATKKPASLKVKLNFLDDTFLLIVPTTVTYSALLDRVERKIRLCGKQTPSPLRIKYKDEDDDFVTMHSDEDIQMALEPLRQLSSSSTSDSLEEFAKPANGGLPELTIWAA